MMSTAELALAAQRTRAKMTLEQQQCSTPTDLSVAHTLGLMCYWEALQPGSEPQRADLLRAAAGNWAMVLESNDYWRQWSTERRRTYDTPLDQKAIESARQSVREQIQRTLATVSSNLEDAFRLETKAIRLLQQASRKPSPNGQPLVCGPWMAQRLRVEKQIGQYLGELQIAEGQLSEILELFQRMLGEARIPEGLAAFDARAKRQLMSCFSQLAYPALYLDLKRPQRAIEVLAQASCTECGGYRPSTGMPNHLQLPHTCADACPLFAEQNPAYAQLPNRAATLWQHAIDLAVQAHLQMAEQCLTATTLDAATTIHHWQDALTAATVSGDASHLHGTIADVAIARAAAMEKNNRLDDAISLIEATTAVSTDARLRGKLAEFLTDRGVKAGKAAQWEAAVSNLRQACSLNPHVKRTRDSFVIALHERAIECQQAGDVAAARPLLEEAVQVLKEGLNQDPGDQDLRSRLIETEMQLSMINVMGAASAENPLGLLLAILGGLAETQGDQKRSRLPSPSQLPALPGSDELRQSAADKAQRKDFEGAIADLEKALRQAPADGEIKRALASALEQYADSLMAKHEFERARAMVARGLTYAPGDPGLQATLATIQLFQPLTEALEKPLPPAEEKPAERRRGLRGALARLLGREKTPRPGPSRLQVGPQTADVLRTCLQGTSLKFQERGAGHFQLPFTTENVGRLMARAETAGGVVTLVVPMQSRVSNEAVALHNLLRGTFDTDFYKLCQRGNSLSLETQAPIHLLTSNTLEEAVRGLTRLADLATTTLNSETDFRQHMAQIESETAMRYVQASDGFRRETEQTTRWVVDLARAAGMRYLSTNGNRIRLAFGAADLKVLVICKGKAVITIAYMSDMRPARGQTPFFRRMAEINAEMEICKVALDNDDDAAFMYELPAVDEDAFRQMRGRMEEYIMRYGFELTILAAR